MDEQPRDIAPIPPADKAPLLYLIAVIVLGVVSLAAVVLIGALSFTGKTVPDILGSLGLVALSAIAGMVYVSKTQPPA